MRRPCASPRVMSGSAAFTDRKAPVRLTSSMRCQCARSILAAGALSAAPALAIRMSIGPCAARAAAAMAVAVRLARHVGDDGLGARQLRRDLLERPGAPAGDGDGGARLRQRPRDGGADAAAAAGDQRVLAVQRMRGIGHHTFSAAGSVRTASRCS